MIDPMVTLVPVAMLWLYDAPEVDAWPVASTLSPTALAAAFAWLKLRPVRFGTLTLAVCFFAEVFLLLFFLVDFAFFDFFVIYCIKI